MTTDNGATQPNNETTTTEAVPSAEQAQVQSIEEDRRQPAPELEEQQDRPKAEEEPKKPPVDPRGDRLEQIASRRQQANAEELAEIAETIVRPGEPEKIEEPESAPVPERKLRLKIRGEEKEMTESEVIALAQKNGAGDDYLAESRRIRDEIDQLRREVRKAPEGETVEERQVREDKIDRLGKAIDLIQSGGDPAEARAVLAEEVAEQARSAAREIVDGDREAGRSARYDADFEEGFTLARGDHKELMENPVTFNMVHGLAAELQRTLIVQTVEGLDGNSRNAFAQAGITPDSLAGYAPHEVTALYKDMVLKGYPLHRPSAVIRSAAKTIAENMPGATRPAPAPTTEPQRTQPALDRTQRKEALVQPERTSIPRPQPGRQPPPQGEKERAASARAELRGARRTGAPVRA